MDVLELSWMVFMAKVLLAIGCGFLIGLEREAMGKPAGIKTHTLICLGSCLFTHVSMLTTSGDPTRIAAQVVSGVGFIGAGTILQSKHRIEGLTSASLVFVNAAIGMLIGANYMVYALLATGSLMGLFQILRINPFQTPLQSFRIHVSCHQYDGIQAVIDHLTTLKCTITHKKIEKKGPVMELSVTYLSTPLGNHRVLAKLHRLPTIDGFTQV